MSVIAPRDPRESQSISVGENNLRLLTQMPVMLMRPFVNEMKA